LAIDLRQLRDEHAVRVYATVLDEKAEPLSAVKPPIRAALMFGNEAQGLDAHWIEQADQAITIPMGLGTDSLNVSVAAAIFLYHFTQMKD
jgi:TrmH family RNA methyltransferase